MSKSRSTTPKRKQKDSQCTFEKKLGLFILILAGAAYYATFLLSDFSSAGAGLRVDGASVLDDSFVNITFPQCLR